jgi:hypothetical protein
MIKPVVIRVRRLSHFTSQILARAGIISHMKRVLGRSGIEVSALGLGCWAIGGVVSRDQRPFGSSGTDDNESIRALHRALDLDVNFF